MVALRGVLGPRAWEIARGDLIVPDHGGEGFDWDEIRLQKDGRTVVSFSINELLIAWDWEQPQPLATAPDLLGLVTEAGIPLTLAEVRDYIGTPTIIVGIQVDERLRDPSIDQSFREALGELGYPGPFVTGSPASVNE